MTAALATPLSPVIAPSHDHPLLRADERATLATISEFAHDVIAPGAAHRDAIEKGDLAWDIVEQGHAIGLLRMAMPQELGGHGLSNLAVAFALEELAAADPGMALVFGATGLFQTPLLICGNTELQERYLTKFLGPAPVLACNAVAEKLNGTDLVLPQNAPYAQSMTTAVREGDSYLLTGTKRYITNAPVATYATVMANIDGHPGSTGMTCFVTDLEQPAVIRGEVHDKVGYRTAPAGELIFDGARVPAENILGDELGGWDLNVAIGNITRVTCASISTGIARHALQRAIDWSSQRLQSGARLYEHQMSARKFADMAARVSASRALYIDAAVKSDNEIPTPAYEPAVAKLVADRAAIDNADAAMSLIGAQAFQREDGMDRVLRDAYGPRIYEGSPEALALVITGELFGASEQVAYL
ncbi:alkylation response protein AidB-like acyl-CoA dehydrogenase [Rhodococcus fascians]|uniref:acyl-CoA dehydrogenase family protein n=1 Tax=Nocardiaceae TaxID=85025 RepID=UPI00285B8E3D|nr:MULTISPECIES: acyl-CoA dehydrogenase family protein [Rhodococcus]MDR6912939.1 alkylation response protein AidB-like acyl-CoA dehydrogenase [Rhodococcus sp. 3258]MDR6934536.1 alkylation response protein AidB-like acyl-CoA dehydrogenase [Rhodococcus fascians]